MVYLIVSNNFSPQKLAHEKGPITQHRKFDDMFSKKQQADLSYFCVENVEYLLFSYSDRLLRSCYFDVWICMKTSLKIK